jgi:hypothetical protein
VTVGTAVGLAAPDVFYFGNAVGETGDSAVNTFVNAADEVNARNNPRTFVNPATVDLAYDFNRDGFVNAADQIIARSSTTPVGAELKLISVPAAFAGLLSLAPESVDSAMTSAVGAALESYRSAAVIEPVALLRTHSPSEGRSKQVGPFVDDRAAYESGAVDSTSRSVADSGDESAHGDELEDLLDLLCGPALRS